MPVVRIDLRRFERMVGAGREQIVERLPYLGLDIEGSDPDSVRVEYSPNRPDFGTDFGIARALKGALGKETGLPRYPISKSGISLQVGPRLPAVRPYIACAVATGLSLGDEGIRQVISLQEDLHNGLGRRRRRVAIGLHDLDRVVPPLHYSGVPPSFSFRPLGGTGDSSVKEILSGTKEGKAYGSALHGSDLFPVITDSKGTVLSLPPVLNGEMTKVTPRTRNLFFDVTGTSQGGVDDVLAIMATTLAEAGGKLGSVSIVTSGRPRATPDLTPNSLPVDLGLINSTLGLDLTKGQVVEALGRSRLDVKRGRALAGRYRVDLLHPVDLAEEVALGYGTERIGPLYPPSESPGSLDRFEEFLDSVSNVMANSGMVELMTPELVDEASLYSKFGREPQGMLRVSDPKSLEHSVLRDSLLPNLATALSSNVKSDYPQRVFEVGRVYQRREGVVVESWHLGCLIAHSSASFTEAKMYLDAAIRTVNGGEVSTNEVSDWAFVPGRTASAYLGTERVGTAGELGPATLEAFGLGVPAAGFEVDLGVMYKLLK